MQWKGFSSISPNASAKCTHAHASDIDNILICNTPLLQPEGKNNKELKNTGDHLFSWCYGAHTWLVCHTDSIINQYANGTSCKSGWETRLWNIGVAEIMQICRSPKLKEINWDSDSLSWKTPSGYLWRKRLSQYCADSLITKKSRSVQGGWMTRRMCHTSNLFFKMI